MPHQHACGGHIEDLARPIMLPEVDLSLLEAFVRVAKPICGHSYFLESRRVFPRDDLGTDYRGRIVGSEPVHHAMHGSAIEHGIVVDEEQQIGVGLDTAQSPVDGSSKTKRARSAQVPPAAAAKMPLCDPFESRW